MVKLLLLLNFGHSEERRISMTEKISEDQVKHVAELAKLKIADDQLPYFTTQLDQIIGLFETLSEVDTDGVEPTSSVTDQINVMRDDVAEDWHQRQALLDNAPDTADGYIRVPTIIDESGENE
jgi:aspartyl-tRNA(Asn)/glutamyl-tRNA(Gln) amidotransferase subunit C